jgi:hypothetical protein
MTLSQIRDGVLELPAFVRQRVEGLIIHLFALDTFQLEPSPEHQSFEGTTSSPHPAGRRYLVASLQPVISNEV